jgi:hypothetical protein
MTYKIRFFSGSVEEQVTAINVLPVRKGHREEYPTGLLRLLCAVTDIRDAVEPHEYEQTRATATSFPDCQAQYPAPAELEGHGSVAFSPGQAVGWSAWRRSHLHVYSASAVAARSSRSCRAGRSTM